MEENGAQKVRMHELENNPPHPLSLQGRNCSHHNLQLTGKEITVKPVGKKTD